MTRADFYVGWGEDAEWIGSVSADGYPDPPNGIPQEILKATSEAEYRRLVKLHLTRESQWATFPDMGWPWPWEDSRTTDYAYAFVNGKVHASRFGRPWFDPLTEDAPYEEEPSVVFPNMKKRQNVASGDRSGLIIFGLPEKD